MAPWESSLLIVQSQWGSNPPYVHDSKSPLSYSWNSSVYSTERKGRALTCTFHSLSNEPPHEVGTVFTPVRASERVDLGAQKKKTVRKFSHSEAGGLGHETNRWRWETKAWEGVSFLHWAFSFQRGQFASRPGENRSALLFKNSLLILQAVNQS